MHWLSGSGWGRVCEPFNGNCWEALTFTQNYFKYYRESALNSNFSNRFGTFSNWNRYCNNLLSTWFLKQSNAGPRWFELFELLSSQCFDDFYRLFHPQPWVFLNFVGDLKEKTWRCRVYNEPNVQLMGGKNNWFIKIYILNQQVITSWL